MSLTKSHRFVCFGVLLLGLLGGTSSTAQPTSDQLVIAHRFDLLAAALPDGELESIATLDNFAGAITFAPDGSLYALDLDFGDDPPNSPVVTSLYTIDEDGMSGPFTTLVLEPGEYGIGLSFTIDGRLFLLTSGLAYWNPPEPYNRLLELDPTTGQLLSNLHVDYEIRDIMPSPRGLWLVANERLWQFDAASGRVEDSGIPFDPPGQIVAADSDSSGAIWLITEPGLVDPPIYDLRRFDPATGALFTRPGIFEPVGAMAIERVCRASPTARCLLGGRFRATVTWRDFENRTGTGRVAATGSADSALFYFFEPSNWELLLKMVDGCDENGHFWVFAAGTTNVEHTLEVRDLLTGETFTATNPLGRASPAVTATHAFTGCP